MKWAEDKLNYSWQSDKMVLYNGLNRDYNTCLWYQTLENGVNRGLGKYQKFSGHQHLPFPDSGHPLPSGNGRWGQRGFFHKDGHVVGLDWGKNVVKCKN